MDNFETTLRSGFTGESTSTFGSRWFLTAYGKAIFKNYQIQNNGLRIVNELIYDELAKQIDVPVAQYIPAEYKSYPISYLLRIDKDKIPKPNPEKIYYGLASFDVAKNDESVFSGADLLEYDGFFGEETLTDYSKALDIFKDGEGYAVDKQKIMLSLYKMMVLDALTFMEDRNFYNVSFLKNDNKKYLTSSPVIDNEMCFAGKNLWYEKKEIPANINLKDFLTLHGREMRLFVNEDVMKSPIECKYAKNVKALVDYSKQSKEMQKFLLNALDKININKAIQKVENWGYEISDEYKDFIRDLMKLSTTYFKNYTNKLQESQDKSL